MSAPDSQPTPAQPNKGVAQDGRHYASWGRRAVGFFLDILPCLILWAIAESYFYSWTKIATQSYYGETYEVVESNFPGVPYFGLFTVSVIYWFWNKGYLEGKTGKSIGKRILGMRTEDENAPGEPIGVKLGVFRALFVTIEYFLIFLAGLGIILWIWPAFDAKRQAVLSDRPTKSVVFTGQLTE